jgi:hypothetical protein
VSFREIYKREALNAYMEKWAALSHPKKLLIALVLLSGCATSSPDMPRETSLAIVKLVKAQH